MTLLDPKLIAPVKAKPKDEAFNENYLICYGNSLIDGNDWYLVTDNDQLGMMKRAFPDDPKIDAEFLADLINAYREGRLVLRSEEVEG